MVQAVLGYATNSSPRAALLLEDADGTSTAPATTAVGSTKEATASTWIALQPGLELRQSPVAAPISARHPIYVSTRVNGEAAWKPSKLTVELLDASVARFAQARLADQAAQPQH